MGEKFEMYARPILECIAALYRNPEHARYLCFAPEHHYADSDKTIRLYHDLHTGEWWWTVQVCDMYLYAQMNTNPVVDNSRRR